MVKFLDLKEINARLKPEIMQAIERVVDSGWYLLGEELKNFEKLYAQYIGTKHCIGVANGLDALRLILRGYIEMGIIKEGDEIIVPSNTYIASILAISENRLIPVLVEPDMDTYNIDPDKIEEKITDKTKGIMLVHLYGKCAMSPKIEDLCKKYQLLLVEDNAQAQGCIYTHSQKRTGSLGNAAGNSFYPGKNLGALGDAGAITTDDDELAALLRSIANYGSKVKYHNDFKGLNSRLDDIQAAILAVKLKYLDQDNQYRRQVAQFYLENISNPQISLPTVSDTAPNDGSNVWHIFPVRTEKRTELQDYLTKNDIQTLIHYPIPPHKQKAYKEWNDLSFPVTEKIHNEIVSLPISSIIQKIEMEKVCEVINKFR